MAALLGPGYGLFWWRFVDSDRRCTAAGGAPMAASDQHSFVIVRYEGRSGAAEALSRLGELEGEGVVEIADAVVV